MKLNQKHILNLIKFWTNSKEPYYAELIGEIEWDDVQLVKNMNLVLTQKHLLIMMK